METSAGFPPVYVEAMKVAGFWPDLVLTDFLDRWSRQRPDATALIDHNSVTGRRTRLSYRELAEAVERIALGLVNLGVEAGQVVSFQLPNWWQFAALHLACLRIGAVSNPLMPIFRERELEFMLGLTESRVLIVPRRFRSFDHAAMAYALRPRLPSLQQIVVLEGDGADSFDEILLRDRSEPAARRALSAGATQPDDTVEIVFTSGTTGEPKGAMHTSNSLFSGLVTYCERLALTERDVVLMASPLAHQTGFIYGFMLPIYLGAPAVFQDVWQPQIAAEIIEREGVTFTMASTPFLSDLVNEAERRAEAFRTLRIFLAGGAPIPRVLVRRGTERLGAEIISAWGMTEVGVVTTTKPGDPPDKAFETDGCPLAGAEVRVVDPAGNPLGAGEEGQLQVRACSRFPGYLKRPHLSGIDADGWFDTGDIARLDQDGYVRITGRAKDIIIRGGENIPVVEIESLLYHHPDVQECAIVAMPDPRLGERACVFVVPRAGSEPTLEKLVHFLAERKMARQYMPERLEIVGELPRTPSGKIQKFKLREIAAAFGRSFA
jgi:cyclohexanecarboxylate-CoA ligase